MGQASNRKKQRRTIAAAVHQSPRSASPSLPAFIPTPPMNPVRPTREPVSVEHRPAKIKTEVAYRFFKELEHARDFAAGRIWISTLETCRNYENKAQGDVGEGTMNYKHTGQIIVDDKDERSRQVAAFAGILVHPGAHAVINGITVRRRIADALVLCMTERYNPTKLSDDFGKFCVEITDPDNLFLAITRELWRRYDIGPGVFSKVQYVGRDFKDSNLPPADEGFLKPVDGYSDQQEVRMLWKVNGAPMLTPGLLHVPDAPMYCRIIDHKL